MDWYAFMGAAGSLLTVVLFQVSRKKKHASGKSALIDGGLGWGNRSRIHLAQAQHTKTHRGCFPACCCFDLRRSTDSSSSELHGTRSTRETVCESPASQPSQGTTPIHAHHPTRCHHTHTPTTHTHLPSPPLSSLLSCFRCRLRAPPPPPPPLPLPALPPPPLLAGFRKAGLRNAQTGVGVLGLGVGRWDRQCRRPTADGQGDWPIRPFIHPRNHCMHPPTRTWLLGLLLRPRPRCPLLAVCHRSRSKKGTSRVDRRRGPV